jgi:iron complex transport system ATP-binding protein
VRVRARLETVDITVGAGEVHALIGPNGSGKSTLLAVLAGDLVPDAGTVAIDGQAVTQRDARTWARRRAVLAQETPMAFPFSVRDVVAWGRLPWRGTPQQADDDTIITSLIDEQGLSDVLERPVTSLSGGERARVHLARVLAQRAPVLLLDEADAALDLAGQAHLDIGRLAAVADSATLLARGCVVAQGSADDTLRAETLTQAYGVSVSTAMAQGRRIYWSGE